MGTQMKEMSFFSRLLLAPVRSKKKRLVGYARHHRGAAGLNHLAGNALSQLVASPFPFAWR